MVSNTQFASISSFILLIYTFIKVHEAVDVCTEETNAAREKGRAISAMLIRTCQLLKWKFFFYAAWEIFHALLEFYKIRKKKRKIYLQNEINFSQALSRHRYVHVSRWHFVVFVCETKLILSRLFVEWQRVFHIAKNRKLKGAFAGCQTR